MGASFVHNHISFQKHHFSSQSQTGSNKTNRNEINKTKEIVTCLKTTKIASSRGKDRIDLSKKFTQIGEKYDGDFIFENVTPLPEYECSVYEV